MPPTLKIHELDVYMKEFLIEKYNVRIHSETNMEPQERWEKGAFIPRLPQSLEQLDLLLLSEAKSRKIKRRSEMVDLLLAAHNEANPDCANLAENINNCAKDDKKNDNKPKLKRYINE